MINYRIFRSDWYESKLNKLDKSEYDRVLKFEQSLKQEPYGGRPLGYKFFREKRFDGKRLIFLLYEENRCVFLVTITDKKAQQREIDLIKSNLDFYRDELERLMKGL